MDEMIRDDQPTARAQKKLLRLRDRLMLTAKSPNRSFYLMVFFLPVIVLELCYIVFRVFPFGDGSLLVLDLNAQYIYYYEGFRDAIFGDGSLIYSWSRTLGGETFGLNAYYMGSPFMLVYLLFPKVLITEALLTTALLRTGLAAFIFAWYLKKTRGGDNSRIMIFSTLYALMGYMVVQQMDPMWLDAVVFLPLVMYGLEKMISENKFLTYTLTLTLIFISNFYIGYMVAIFMVVYFFYAYFTSDRKKSVADFIRKGAMFGFFSILAAGIAAFMLYPAYQSLSLGKMEFSKPDYTPKAKFELLEIIPKLLFGAYDTVRPEGLPTLYTGTLTVLLVPLFFTNRKIPVKRKIGAAAMLLFLFMSMVVSTADLVWHGFQNPNWLNYRYSFIPCAVLLIMAYDAFSNVEGGYTASSVFKAGMIGFAMLLFVDFQNYEWLDERIVVWGGLLVLLIMTAFLAFDAYQNGKTSKITMAVFLGFVCAELFANSVTNVAYIDMDVKYSSRGSYRNFVDKWYPAAEWLAEYDAGFYRTEKTSMRCVNDPFALDIKGISHSSSTLNRDGIDYMEKLGYRVGAHWTEYASPVLSTDAIIGIKYVLEDSESNNGLNLIHQEGDIYIYENPHAMPLLYPVSAQYASYESLIDTDNPFEVQNIMLSAMVGSEEVIEFYTPIPAANVEVEYQNISKKAYGEGYTKYYAEVSEQNCHIEYRVTGVEGQTIYAAFPCDYARKVNLWLNDEFLHEYLTTNEDDGIILVGQYAEGEVASLKLGIPLKSQGGKEEVFLKKALFYTFDGDLFESYFAPIRADVQNFTQESTTNFTMDITAEEGDILYMSIPYESGWHMEVDGEEMEVYRTEDGLIGVTLKAGTHSYELWFMPSYFVWSCVISVASIAVLVMV
ncbi:MAG: YfhO family protein, partial [Clostridia bacterium]|nr:YfhO family protein [Clostridia bacterium]